MAKNLWGVEDKRLHTFLHHSSLSTIDASLEDDDPRTHIRKRLQIRKKDEKRNHAKGKAKRQRTSMKLDTKGKRHIVRLLDKEIATNSWETDTDELVVDVVTMSRESGKISIKW